MTSSFPSQFILLKKTLEHHFPNLLDFVSVLVPWGEGVARVPRPLTGRGALSASSTRWLQSLAKSVLGPWGVVRVPRP